MRSGTLLLSRPFRFSAAHRQIPTQHAVPSGSIPGSGTDEGLTVDSQLHLFNEKSTETCHPFGISPHDPFPRTLALIMLTRLHASDFTMELVPAHARWVMSSLPRRVINILECYLGQGLILTLPFQGVDPEHRILVP